jgi:hypothetical protein
MIEKKIRFERIFDLLYANIAMHQRKHSFRRGPFSLWEKVGMRVKMDCFFEDTQATPKAIM